MHPNWFRIGGVAADLPEGWDGMVRDFISYLPPRLAEYDREVLRNRIFQARTKGIGSFTKEEAIEWGATGPNLRACGLDWDFRKKQPYSGYDQFAFDIPTGSRGDCHSRRQRERAIVPRLGNRRRGGRERFHDSLVEMRRRRHLTAHLHLTIETKPEVDIARCRCAVR